ncbi:MAG: efflux RND transporter periplasmic adaptor subunit [Acidobacteriota bacterium]
MSSERWQTVGTLGLLGLVVGWTAGCGGEVEEAETALRPVRFQEVVVSGERRARTFAGTARAGVESQLSFRIAGTVESVSMVVGETVRRGQELARLDSTDLDLQLQEAEATLAQALAAERKADADYDRTRGLYENQNASKSDLDAARAQSESSQAQVAAARQRRELARRQISYARLTAPVAGAIASVLIEENENVGSGQEVALLASGAQPEVEVAMPEVLIAQVREGDQAQVSFDALPDQSFTGEVTEVGVAATAAGATYPVTVRLGANDSSVRSGMAASVQFQFESDASESHIFVPPEAVGEDRDGRFVFVLEPDASDSEVGQASRRSVTVGDLTPEGIAIRDGLSGGELLITAGVRRIRDGQQVQVLARAQG